MDQKAQNKKNENLIYVVRYQQKIEGQTLSGIYNFYRTRLSAQKGLQRLTYFYSRLGYTTEHTEDDFVKLTDNHDGFLKAYVSPQYIEP